MKPAHSKQHQNHHQHQTLNHPRTKWVDQLKQLLSLRQYQPSTEERITRAWVRKHDKGAD